MLGILFACVIYIWYFINRNDPKVRAWIPDALIAAIFCNFAIALWIWIYIYGLDPHTHVFIAKGMSIFLEDTYKHEDK